MPAPEVAAATARLLAVKHLLCGYLLRMMATQVKWSYSSFRAEKVRGWCLPQVTELGEQTQAVTPGLMHKAAGHCISTAAVGENRYSGSSPSWTECG